MDKLCWLLVVFLRKKEGFKQYYEEGRPSSRRWIDRLYTSSSCSANENIHATMIETNSVHQTKKVRTALADSDETINSTHGAQEDNNNTNNEIKLFIINDDVTWSLSSLKILAIASK